MPHPRSPWPRLSFLFCTLCLAILTVIAVTPAQIQAGEQALLKLTPLPPVKALSRELDPGWRRRHRLISAEASAARDDINLVFLGDSITQGWGRNAIWRRYYETGSRHPLNAGIASDRVEHVLWRTRNGNLDGLHPKVVVLLAGVNNLALAKPNAIAAGSAAIIDEIQRRSPDTKVLLLGLFPSGKEPLHPRRAKIARVNAELSALGSRSGVTYLDIGEKFLAADGSLSRDIMFDYLHLTPKGYAIWARAMEPTLAAMMQ